ncbi:MAG TPA: DUF4352 domain-containing protein [Ktedonobacterales bacterium]|jgi:hypothetical protein
MVSRKRLIITFSVSFFVLIFILACGGTDTGGGNTGSVATGTVAAPTQASHFKVGDQVKIGSDWLVIVNSVKTSKGSSFSPPQQGNTYLVVDVTVKNLGSQKQTVSSLLSFTLKDSTGQKYDEAITSGVGTPPDGDLTAGDQLKGQLVYEVPATQKQFTLAFNPDLTSDPSIWDLSL